MQSFLCKLSENLPGVFFHNCSKENKFDESHKVVENNRVGTVEAVKHEKLGILWCYDSATERCRPLEGGMVQLPTVRVRFQNEKPANKGTIASIEGYLPSRWILFVVVCL